MSHLCAPQHDVMKLLKGNSELLGILLGYGPTNSRLFERKANICRHLQEKMTPPFTSRGEIEKLQPAGQKLVELYKEEPSRLALDIFPSSKYDSLADELNDILVHEEVFELYGSDFFLDKIISPVFMMRKEEIETCKLRKSYSVTRARLRQIYHQGSFLEITLTQWISPR